MIVAKVVFISFGALHSPLLVSLEKNELRNLPELFDLREASIYLVAHGGHHVIDWNHAFLIDQGLAPDLRVHFVPRLQMLADIVLFLSDGSELFAAMNVDSGLRLSQHGATRNTEELSVKTGTRSHLRLRLVKTVSHFVIFFTNNNSL